MIESRWVLRGILVRARVEGTNEAETRTISRHLFVERRATRELDASSTRDTSTRRASTRLATRAPATTMMTTRFTVLMTPARAQRDSRARGDAVGARAAAAGRARDATPRRSPRARRASDGASTSSAMFSTIARSFERRRRTSGTMGVARARERGDGEETRRRRWVIRDASNAGGGGARARLPDRGVHLAAIVSAANPTFMTSGREAILMKIYERNIRRRAPSSRTASCIEWTGAGA